MSPSENPSAFPDNGRRGSYGMTLRDYFAAKAMHALIVSACANGKLPTNSGLAKDSYVFADAMLRERAGNT